MKKIVIAFFALLVFSNAFALVKTHSKAGKPTMTPLQLAPNVQTFVSVFLSPPKYIKQFSPDAFRYDTLFYIDTTNPPLPYSFLPAQIKTGATTTDTIVARSERFTSTYSGYIDAVQVGMAIEPSAADRARSVGIFRKGYRFNSPYV
jgi:hypothetical protein